MGGEDRVISDKSSSAASTDFAPKHGLCFQHSTEQQIVNDRAKNKIVVPKTIQASKRLPPLL